MNKFRMADAAATATMDPLDLHRRQFLAQLGTSDLVYDPQLRAADELLSDLPRLCEGVAANGWLVLAAAGDTGRLQAELDCRFPVVLRFLQRPVSGSIFAEPRFAATRVTALESSLAVPEPACELFVCGRTRPPLRAGLIESRGRGGSAFPDAPRHAGLDGFNALRSQAAALIDRLVEVDEARLAASLDAEVLRAQLNDRAAMVIAPRSGGGIDLPRDPHAWPLLENPDLTPETLDKYDRRFDDDLVSVAAAGTAFMAEFGLAGEAPDFAAVVAALNAMPRTLPLVDDVGMRRPTVSIIIPVYGQLGYTLNCLDALFRHKAGVTCEIIVADDVSPDATAECVPQIRGVRVLSHGSNLGFARNCNAAAEAARGEILVLLNNDTRVMPGWLDSLVESFALFPKTGLVGSKLLYPDGRLQEAGGIVWRDASAWNFGRDDDPNRPQYCYAREVDYVSGASIAVRASIWQELGGFDPYLAPAYYEDVDLAFRIRAAGYETWYQPCSRVVHYEGRTSGTSTESGVKAYQIINRGKFHYRHRHTLETHRRTGESPLLECERKVRKRILIIDASFLTPGYDAGSLYTLMTMKLLMELGYKVTFIAAHNFLFEPEHIVALQKIGVECGYAPYDVRVEQYLARYGALFDVVLVFRFAVLEEVAEIVRRYAPSAPLLFNNQDLHYLRMQRGAELTGDAQAMAEAERLKYRELAAMTKADCITTPSSYEVDILARELPQMPALELPLIVEAQGTDIGFSARRDVCYLGGYAHAPNVDAVMFFARKILPLLKRSEPRIRFIIAGAHPTPEIRALASDDIIVTGMVPDLRDVFDTVRVAVYPLRFGAGTKGKILAAMSFGVPVVTTAIGIEGIGGRDGEDVLLAEQPAAFAAATLRLYQDQKLWRRLSRNGMKLLEARYSRESGRRAVAAAIEIGYRRLLGIDLSASGERQTEAAE